MCDKQDELTRLGKSVAYGSVGGAIYASGVYVLVKLITRKESITASSAALTGACLGACLLLSTFSMSRGISCLTS